MLLRQDDNNHLVQGLFSFLEKKTVVYDEDDVTAQAVLSTALTGNNNDLDFTAVPYGLKGNNISIVYVDPGGATATLSVVVSGNLDDGLLITVNLGRAASAINTTGDLLKTAWEASDANDYATVADKAANDGSGLVTAMTVTALAGGQGRTLFEVTGDVAVLYLGIATENFSGSGTIGIGTESVENALLNDTPATDIDAGMVATFDGVNTFNSINQSNLLVVPRGEDIRDWIATDTVSGTIDHYLFWYPISEDGNVVVTND